MPSSRSPHFDLVVLGASSGGLAAVSSVLASLPADFPAPIVVVQHRSMQAPEMLADILSRRTPLRVKPGEAGEVPRAGTVYIAPPIAHLSIGLAHAIELSEPTSRRLGPASADALFTSAAAAYGPRLVAVVLSGTGSDGSAGARAVDLSGGTVLAQDESTSHAFGMPSAAIATGAVDAVLPLNELGPALVRLLVAGELTPVSATALPARAQRSAAVQRRTWELRDKFTAMRERYLRALGRNGEVLARVARDRLARQKVLVVDDEPSVVAFLSRVLHDHGYEPLTAADAAQALLLVEQPEQDLALIVVDTWLPDMTGPQLIERVRSGHPDQRFLRISAVQDRQPDGRLVARGIPSLAKPFGIDEFVAHVDALVPTAS